MWASAHRAWKSDPEGLKPTRLFSARNLTGSAKFRALILEGKYDDALTVARQQVESGAVIIDVNLGAEVEGGFDLCRELRARSAQLPIIFLTARESEIDG